MPNDQGAESLRTAQSVETQPDDAASRSDHDAAVMARNGITCIPVDYYHVGGYRYTTLTDALAEVTRGARGRETRDEPA